MSDCEHPKCHEEIVTGLQGRVTWTRFDELRDDVNSRVPKKWVWLALGFIGIPLFATSVGVWSNQQSDYLKYASKDEMKVCQIRIEKLEQSSEYTTEDLNEIKSDIKVLLKIVRNFGNDRRSHDEDNPEN